MNQDDGELQSTRLPMWMAFVTIYDAPYSMIRPVPDVKAFPAKLYDTHVECVEVQQFI